MNRFQVLEAAEQDLFEIWSFIAIDNVQAADRVERDIRDMFPRLAEFPGMGHTRHDLVADDLLFVTVRSVYQIVYDPKVEPLTILRVLRGGLDVPTELSR